MEEGSEFLKCTICMDTFRQPRILPCLHSFCETCLHQHTQIHCGTPYTLRSDHTLRYHGRFPCPTCREEVTMPHNGVQGFRHDFRVEQFLDWFKQLSESRTKYVNQEEKSDVEICKFCNANGKSRTAAAYCTNCQKELCSKCAERHVRKTVFSDHVINKSGSCHMGTDDMHCQTHKGEVISYICMKCNVGICGLCCMTTHDNHNILDYKMGVKCYRDNLSFLKKTLVTRVSQLYQFMKDLALKERQLNASKSEIKDKIKQRCEDVIRTIKEREEEMLGDVDVQFKTDTNLVRSAKSEMELAIVSMESLREFTSDLMKRKIALQMLPIYADLISRMDKVLEDSLHLKINGPGIMNFVASRTEPKLGKIKYVQDDSFKSLETLNNGNSTSIHKKIVFANYPVVHSIAKIGHQGNKPGEFDSPRDVAFISNTTFVVADTTNNRLQVFNLDGSIIKVIGEGNVKPWGVVVTSEGHIAVADALEKCIKVYDIEGTEMNKHGEFLCPCGIALDRDDNFIATDFFSTALYVIDQFGATVRKFDFRDKSDQHASGASRVAVSNHGNIIVSDISNMCVKIFDATGKYLSRISNHDLLENPHGVCIDVFDRIFVADICKHQILVFNMSGRFVHRLFLNSGEAREPLGIALSTNGILVLTDGRTNQVKVYKLDYVPGSPQSGSSDGGGDG